MTSDQELENLVKDLMKYRKETMRFYEKILDKTKHPQLSKELKNLIKEEKNKITLTQKIIQIIGACK